MTPVSLEQPQDQEFMGPAFLNASRKQSPKGPVSAPESERSFHAKSLAKISNSDDVQINKETY